MKNLRELVLEKKMSSKQESFIALYDRSGEAGSKLAEKIQLMYELMLENIEARKDLAEAFDDGEYKDALKAYEKLNEKVLEVEFLLHELGVGQEELS